MHICDSCRVNPAVVAFGSTCLCQQCSQAPFVTGGIENVSPFGVLFPPLGIAEGFGAPPALGMSMKNLAASVNRPPSPPTPPQRPADLQRRDLPPPPDDERDGFPFLKVMFVLGTVAAVGVVGTALLRATKTAKYVREGAADAIKKHPEILAAV